jgi:hypothetical protein
MAVLQMITCDLCRDESVKGRHLYFSVDGKEFTLDVCDEHLSEFRTSIGPYVSVATPTTRAAAPKASRSSGSDRRSDLADIRIWANENGFTVAERGRVPLSVIEAYDLRDAESAPARRSRKKA